MPSIRDDAVCIRHWDFSETSQTVSLFAREAGLIRGLAKGAKREKGTFSGGIELLTRGQLCAIVKPNRELATLTEWDLREIFPALSRNLRAHYAGLYFADLVQAMFSPHDPHPRLFDALVEALRSLDAGAAAEERSSAGGAALPADLAAAVLRFEWTTLVEAGYEPALSRDAQTGAALDETRAGDDATLAFSAVHGGVVADTGASDRWRVRRETLEALRLVAMQVAESRVGADHPSPTESASPDNMNRPPRRESDEASQRAAAGAKAPRPIGAANSDAPNRAARLLAAYIRTIIDREPATMRLLFGPLEV